VGKGGTTFVGRGDEFISRELKKEKSICVTKKPPIETWTILLGD